MTDASQIQAAVRTFLDEGPRFAQLITVDSRGAPVTRTVGAEVGADWTVELVARRGHARLRQLAANPWMQLVFVSPARRLEPVARPAVIDYGLPVPAVVALTGWAEPLNAQQTLAAYQRQRAAADLRGNTRAPQRTDEQVRTELTGTRMHVITIRAEGFGEDAESLTWAPPAAALSPRNPATDVPRGELA